MASAGSPTTTLNLTITIAGVACALLLVLAAGATPPRPGDFEDDKVHEFLGVLDRAAAYRRECFGECAKGCYCADNPYSCLRECMPTPPTRRCGATYGAVQGLFSSSATFTASATLEEGERVVSGGDGAAAGEGFFAGAT